MAQAKAKRDKDAKTILPRQESSPPSLLCKHHQHHPPIMAATRTCVAQWGRSPLSSSFRPQLQCLRTSTVTQQSRNAAVATGANSANAAKYKRKELSTAQKKKKQRSHFVNHDLKEMEQYALCDAMRYVLVLVTLIYSLLILSQIHTGLRSRLSEKSKI